MSENMISPDDELEFENIMKERFDDSFSDSDGQETMDERLKEMNKKLPDWNLEPPFTYLK